jgi:hypothetical protein
MPSNHRSDEKLKLQLLRWKPFYRAGQFEFLLFWLGFWVFDIRGFLGFLNFLKKVFRIFFVFTAHMFEN